jgi:mono/diheme cytochrome c family protein
VIEYYPKSTDRPWQWRQALIRGFREDATKLPLCGLATGFLWNAVGVSAAFSLVGSFTAVASAETPVERGSYLVNSIGSCGNCHGREDFHPGMTLAGGLVLDAISPALGHVVAPNITPDKDTGIGNWSEADIVMALRNGKRPDGSIIGPLKPIPVYRQLSDQDATAIAAYLLSAKPIKNSVEKSQFKVPLTDYGPPVTHVDAPSSGDKVAYGAYLVTFGQCVLCHTPRGDDGKLNMKLAFAGGHEFPRFGEIAPSISRNITPDPDQGLGKWSDDQIKTAITKAVRPVGTKLAGPMPYEWYARSHPPISMRSWRL